MIKTTGKEKNYELIEYISDVSVPTVTARGRSVVRPNGAKRFDWGMPKDVTDINLYGRTQMEEKGVNIVINC